MHTDIQEGTAVFTGTVGRREQKEGTQVYYLKDTDISGTRWILVYLNHSNSQYFIGNTLKIYGTIKKYETPGNPGQFDGLIYYQTRKIDGMCFAQKVELVDGKKDSLREGLLQIRLRLGEELERCLDQSDSGILKAMLLGERRDLGPEIRELYQESGISHLLAISGLHISILGAGLYRLLRKTGLPSAAAGIPALIFMGCYGILIGAGASTLRALIMFALTVGADFLGRSYDIRTALGVTAIGLLLEQPLYARDGAFLLSFGAILGLTQINPVLKGMWERESRPEESTKVKGVIGFLKDGFCTSLSVQIMTLPVLLYCFYQVPLYAPLLNLLVVPLMGPLLTAGLVCVSLSWASSFPGVEVLVGGLAGIARIFAWVCHGILWVVEQGARISSSFVGAMLTTGRPETWQIVVYYLGVLGFLLFAGMHRWKREKNRSQEKSKEWSFKARLLAGAVYAAALLVLFLRPEPEFTMTMLDVGQGDSIYFKTRGGSSFLMDGGSSSEELVGQYILEPFLKCQGQAELDYVLISHGDEDHVSGIREILDGNLLSVGCLILPESGREDETCRELAALAKGRGTSVIWMKAGDRLQDRKLLLRCLAPEKGRVYEDKNAGSLVLSLEYKSLHILLTGDLEGSGERLVLEQGLLEKDYDILKVAHHGSRYSTGEDWLSKVQPEVSLISCGEDNSYGHPHGELLERLKKAGSRIYRTSQKGAVTVTSNGQTYEVQTYLP